MAVWRYVDMGFTLLDNLTINLDVEGVSWAPAAAGLQIDNFPLFQLSLAHSAFAPDEFFDPIAGAILAPQSGLVTTFASNLLDPVNDPLTVVHSKPQGYLVQPLDSFFTNSGTLLAPWPLNRNVPIQAYNYWTWRDTSIQSVGGVGSNGVPPLSAGGGLATTTLYGAGAVPTVGLPMLLEFRTYPSDTPNALNMLSYAVVNTTFINPRFRIHSTGGILPSGLPKNVDPDLEVIAQGGLTAGGTPTLPSDNFFYYGQADFVSRVNRVVSKWLDAGNFATFLPATFEPGVTSLPPGTGLKLEFRGATNVSNPNVSGDATNYDPYGDPSPLSTGFNAGFVNGDNSWHTDPSALAGARFIQFRVTLTGNPESGVTPEFSAIGIPFFE